MLTPDSLQIDEAESAAYIRRAVLCRRAVLFASATLARLTQPRCASC
jgi:hypothetical protein